MREHEHINLVIEEAFRYRSPSKRDVLIEAIAQSHADAAKMVVGVLILFLAGVCAMGAAQMMGVLQ